VKRRYELDVEVRGPWSLRTSRAFWEGFAAAALPAHDQPDQTQQLRTVFCAEADWSRAEVVVTHQHSAAHLAVTGHGDLEAAAAQACRFLSLDVDARGWPDVATRDPVIAAAQAQLPGLRPCGFHSAYEAAAWSVLSQRVRTVHAARLRDELVTGHGDRGAFPAPAVLRAVEVDLPGRKPEYLHAVAEAALEGRLDGTTLRALDPEEAVRAVQQIKGLGPLRGPGSWTWRAMPRMRHRRQGVRLSALRSWPATVLPLQPAPPHGRGATRLVSGLPGPPSQRRSS